ncbi:MAG: alpha/beta hydrolase [Acidimicrobiia bacterium]|nr:alpha/beta hydrolase [Acidimicrobiia bacterium]MCY4434661.1 alpha/beta hydrolase [bacterium]
MQTVTTTVAGLGMREFTGGSGDPLVMLHHSFGNPGWMPIHEALADHYSVHALDLPGYGGPEGSEQPDWARHPRDLALIVGQWLRTKDFGPVELVGSGFGGWVAAELATMAPELLKRLVLVGAAGLLPEQGRIYDQFLVSHSNYVQAAFSSQDVYEAIFHSNGDDPDEHPLGDDTLVMWDMNREMTTRVGWKPYMYNRRLRPLLGGVTVPSLVVWGDSDAVVPLECAHAYVEALPDARLEIVPDCGHAVDLEAPESLAAIITGGSS